MIYLAGYSDPQTSLDAIQAFVEERQGILVDIRYKPSSRRPGCSKAALMGRFGDAYRWMPAFGNVNYKAAGAPIRLADPQAGVLALDAEHLGAARPAVLLCQCTDRWTCHRASVARHLFLARGYPLAELSDVLTGRLTLAEFERQMVEMAASALAAIEAFASGRSGDDLAREADDPDSQIANDIRAQVDELWRARRLH